MSSQDSQDFDGEDGAASAPSFSSRTRRFDRADFRSRSDGVALAPIREDEAAELVEAQPDFRYEQAASSSELKADSDDGMSIKKLITVLGPALTPVIQGLMSQAKGGSAAADSGAAYADEAQVPQRNRELRTRRHLSTLGWKDADIDRLIAGPRNRSG